jgi:hypothetical protein
VEHDIAARLFGRGRFGRSFLSCMRRRALFLIPLFAPRRRWRRKAIVFERGTELGFRFVRSGIFARRRLLEDLYSFR